MNLVIVMMQNIPSPSRKLSRCLSSESNFLGLLALLSPSAEFRQLSLTVRKSAGRVTGIHLDSYMSYYRAVKGIYTF